MSSLFKKTATILISASLSFTFVASYTVLDKALHIATADELQEADENTPASVPSLNGFTDVHEEDYHYVAIRDLALKGILNGYEDGSFHPDDPINRVEALKIILESFGNFSENEYTEPEKRPFQDIPLEAWHTKYIVIAKDKGTISGYEDGTFRPWETINLAESLKMITQSLSNYIKNYADELYADVPLDTWYSEYFAYAKVRSLLNISENNRVYPEQEMTRGYFAEIIYRLKKSFEGYNFGKATFYGAAVHGNNTASGKTFDMYAMTAAHKTLPFGTIVEVTNLANGETVEVEITDRGPYGPGRVLDLTSSAFDVISDLHRGIIHVQYIVVSEPSE